jgi:hypothetical protein
MTGYNWDRVNLENREMRHRNASQVATRIDLGDFIRKATKPNPKPKAKISKIGPSDRKGSKGSPTNKPVSPLVAAIGQIAKMKDKEIVGWSDAELKNARDLCNDAALRFNEYLKKPRKKSSRLPQANKRG